MQFSLILALAVVAAHAVSATTIDNEDYSSSLLDVKRPAKILSGENSESRIRKSGYVYVEKMQTRRSFLANVRPGVKASVSTTMIIENEMTVTDASGGGQSIVVENTHASIDAEGLGDPIHCELGAEEAKLKASCAEYIPLLKVANATDTVVIDEQGHVVAEDSSTSLYSTRNQNSNAIEAITIGLNDQIRHSSKTMKMIPGHPVKPGDSWPVREEFSDSLESLEGTCKMLGYKNYKGSDCAVIFVGGTLHVELKEMLKKMGLPVDEDAGDKLDATISQVMFWDYQAGISRWSQTSTSMNLEYKDPVDGSMAEMPFNETIRVYTDIKRKLPPGSEASGSAVQMSLWFVLLTGLSALGAVAANWKYGGTWKPDPDITNGQELVPMAPTQVTLL